MTRLTILLPLLGALAVAAQSQSQGCYSSAGSLQNQGVFIYQSTGYCATTCKKYSKSAMATTNGNECYCGDELPPASGKVEDSNCDIPCAGYPMETCGGKGFFSVALVEASDNMTSYSSSSSSSSSPATTPSPAPVAPTGTNTAVASSTSSTAAQYTGAAAHPVLGAGALAIGALVAVL